MTTQSEIQALKCADCARSDSAVSDLQPDSLLPIPADALSGWRDGQARAPHGVTRRKLLRNGVLGFAAVYGATQLVLRGRLGVGGRAGGRADAARASSSST